MSTATEDQHDKWAQLRFSPSLPQLQCWRDLWFFQGAERYESPILWPNKTSVELGQQTHGFSRAFIAYKPVGMHPQAKMEICTTPSQVTAISLWKKPGCTCMQYYMVKKAYLGQQQQQHLTDDKCPLMRLDLGIVCHRSSPAWTHKVTISNHRFLP